MKTDPPSYSSAQPVGKWNFKDRKVRVRFVNTIFAFVGLLLEIVAEATAMKDQSLDSPRPLPWDWTVFILCLVWNIAEILTIRIRKDKQGIHPAANLTFDLLLWIGFLASGPIQMILCRGHPLTLVAGGMEIKCGIGHFYLFVRDCIQVHRDRKMRLARHVPAGMALVTVETLADLQNSKYATLDESKVSGDAKARDDVKSEEV